MNHEGLRWNVHCVANVGLRIRLNLYKRGFKIYDLLVDTCCNLLREDFCFGGEQDWRDGQEIGEGSSSLTA